MLEDTLQSQLWTEKKHQQKATSHLINEFITHSPKQGKEETTALKMGKKNENRKEKKKEGGKWKGKWKILTRFVRIRGAEPAEHTARTQQTFTRSYLSKLCVATILLRPRRQLKLGKSLWEKDEDED